MKGKLIAESKDAAYTWMRNNDAGSRSRIFIDNSTIEDGATLTINAVEGTILDGFNAVIDDVSTPMIGTQHNISFESDSDDTWIEFTGIQSLNLILDSTLILEYEDGTTLNLENWNDAGLGGENWMLASESKFEMNILGELLGTNASIVGAEIIVDGTMSFNGILSQSTPIIASNDAQIHLEANMRESSEMITMLLQE